MRNRPGDGSPGNATDLSLPDRDPCGNTHSTGHTDQNDDPEPLSAWMWVLNQQHGFCSCRKDTGAQCAAFRFAPDQQHHQQAQDTTGKAVKNCCQAAENQAGKNNLRQHQEYCALPVHQVDCI